ncbi:YlzJ-like family protein [Bacillaceae bacterium W0354]
MILYTPLHEQEIFYEEEEDDNFYWVNVDHATLKLKRDAETNGFEIVHMCSTNPSDYLNNKLRPGTIFYL